MLNSGAAAINTIRTINTIIFIKYNPRLKVQANVPHDNWKPSFTRWWLAGAHMKNHFYWSFVLVPTSHCGTELPSLLLLQLGGIKYDKTEMAQSVKGWSEGGIARFNALFDQVIADRAENPDFERNWLKARNCAQDEEGTTAKKRKRQPTQAHSEILVSDDDNSIAPNSTGAHVESGSDTEDETN